MAVIKDPKELQSEIVIAEAYMKYWNYRADHIEQLTDVSARNTRAMLLKAQALLDDLRRGGKTTLQQRAEVEPVDSTEDQPGMEFL